MPLPPRALPRTLALAVLLAAGFAPARAAEYRAVRGLRPGHVAWVYRQPDVASPRVAYLRAGNGHVRTTGCRKLAAGSWCRVVVRGTRGWVQDRFLRAGGAVLPG
jgi:uncharacterized protein YraI